MKNRIREFRENAKISQETLGERIGVTKATVSKLEKGQQPLTQKYMEDIAEALKCEAYELIAPDHKINKIVPFMNNNSPEVLSRSHLNTPHDSNTSDVPVYGPAFGGSPDIIKFTEEYVIDYQPRHPAIMNVKGGFAMLVDGESMAPRKYPGELLYIHPYKDPSIERDCVVVLEPEGNAIYKLYCGKTKDGKGIKLKQLNPANEFVVPLEKVRKIYAGF